MISVTILLLALLLDHLIGEPPVRYHPLVFFGRLAERVERFIRHWKWTKAKPTFGGLLGWLLLAVSPGILLWQVLHFLPEILAGVLECLVLYFAIGWKSLRQHARDVFMPLSQGDVALARQKVGKIVSRDTNALDQQGIVNATIESVLENGSDGVLAAIFWFLLFGAPGVLVYRFANTLDAMWGYKSKQYLHFGRVAAKMDDYLNWIPARLTAISYAFVGRFSTAVNAMFSQGPLTESPNAGWVMAAGAGALGIRLGGPVVYQGERVERPVLGSGSEATVEDINHAVALLRRALVLWVLCAFLVALL